MDKATFFGFVVFFTGVLKRKEERKTEFWVFDNPANQKLIHHHQSPLFPQWAILY